MLSHKEYLAAFERDYRAAYDGPVIKLDEHVFELSSDGDYKCQQTDIAFKVWRECFKRLEAAFFEFKTMKDSPALSRSNLFFPMRNALLKMGVRNVY